MTLRALLLALTLHGTASAQTPDSIPGDTLATDPTRDAYLDETARHLVLGVKAARDTAQLGIDGYTALIRERLGMDAPTFGRDRPYVSGERVTRVRWSRDEPDVAHVLGSRFRDPGQAPGDPRASSRDCKRRTSLPTPAPTPSFSARARPTRGRMGPPA